MTHQPPDRRRSGRTIDRSAVAGKPSGFTFEVVGHDVLIRHNGRRATTLRGATAQKFLVDIEQGDPQQLMARLTGNYKHGNERSVKHRP